MSNKSDQSVYAAGQAREFLRQELDGKPNHWIREYAGFIDDRQTLNLLNYLCSIWNPEDSAQPDDFLDSKLAEVIVRSAATRTADAAFKNGEASQLQGIVGLVQQEGDATEALTEIVTRLSQEGTIAVLTGPPGAGKTATLLDVMNAWRAFTGGYLFSNVGWDRVDEQVETDLEMLEAMASADGPTLGGIDEANRGSLTGRGSDSKKAETFANRGTMIRKQEGQHGPHAKRGSLVMVSHNWDRMNAPVRRMTTLVISKPSRQDPSKVVLWSSPGGEDRREKIGQFGGLTDTRESYHEHEASAFDVVLPDDGDDGSGVDEDEVRWLSNCETAIRRKLQGATHKEAASVIEFGRGWVGQRWREWKGGDHRDLVPFPDDLDAIPESIANELEGTR